MKKKLRIIGNIAMVLSLLLLTWLMGGAVAYGWMAHADHYGAVFRTYSIWYFAGAGGMTFAALLYFCRKDLAAAICGAVSYLPVLTVLLRAMNAAETAGWSGQTEQSFGRNAAAVWRNGMMPCAVTLALLLLLTLTRWFSYDAAVQRRAKREAADAEPAPSILGDAERQENR
ncbi:MAG TPA: hypothetical protein DDX71_00450 [Ruminococcus sp.]|nr:hypothetical protein [Ruminococcus sp.]